MPLRMTTSLLVRREGRMLLFDAGEGIQIQLKRGGLGIRALDAVAISHLHADHVLGLPGILMFRAQCDDPGLLDIIGPPGLERFVRHTIEDLGYRLDFELRFIEWSLASGPAAYSWHGSRLAWAPLEHSTFCLGYRLEEAERPGRFFPDRAAAQGVPAGPLFGRLQAGETVVLADGRQISPQMVLGPPRRGRVIAFATDTRPCPELVELCRDVDIAFVEGMFTCTHEEEARRKMHMTAAQAALAAREASAKRLVLVHLSPRYGVQDEAVLAAQAAAFFPGAEVGRGLEVYDVPLPD